MASARGESVHAVDIGGAGAREANLDVQFRNPHERPIEVAGIRAEIGDWI